jgi:ABC-type multidrug transport system ATPase subunit
VLAGVVAIQPRVLVLDEPTSMLDPRSGRQFHALVRDLWKQGTTVVYITHLMDEVVTATRIIALANGHVEFDGSPRDFFSQGELLKKNNLVPPLPVRLSVALASKGHKVPLALTISELVEGVCAWS